MLISTQDPWKFQFLMFTIVFKLLLPLFRNLPTVSLYEFLSLLYTFTWFLTCHWVIKYFRLWPSSLPKSVFSNLSFQLVRLARLHSHCLTTYQNQRRARNSPLLTRVLLFFFGHYSILFLDWIWLLKVFIFYLKLMQDSKLRPSISHFCSSRWSLSIHVFLVMKRLL